MNVIFPKEEYKSKDKFLIKRATDLYLQRFYKYISSPKIKVSLHVYKKNMKKKET